LQRKPNRCRCRSQAQSLADATAKVSIASGLVAYGEKNKDAYALLTAAKMLSQVGAKVEDPKGKEASGKASELDVGAILKKASDYAGDNDALKKDISMAEKAMPQKWVCYYAWACNYYYCNYNSNFCPIITI